MSKIETYKIDYPNIKSGSVYTFTTKSGVIYEVRFGRKEHNILNVSIVFGVKNDEFEGEEYSLTNRGEVYNVMKTIAEIVKIYKNEHLNITSFEYSGEQSKKEKDKNKNIRLLLYSRYINDVFDSNWKIEQNNDKVIIKKV